MGDMDHTVRKNKNCAHLTLAAQTDKLGSIDELPVEIETEILPGCSFPNWETENGDSA